MVASNWLRCRGWILPALVDATEEELLADLASGHAQLWPGERSAVVTQLVQPHFLHVWLAGGDKAELVAMRAGLEAWGRAQGCAYATINGRKGWARVLGAYGYERDGEELRKALA